MFIMVIIFSYWILVMVQEHIISWKYIRIISPVLLFPANRFFMPIQILPFLWRQTMILKKGTSYFIQPKYRVCIFSSREIFYDSKFYGVWSQLWSNFFVIYPLKLIFKRFSEIEPYFQSAWARQCDHELSSHVWRLLNLFHFYILLLSFLFLFSMNVHFLLSLSLMTLLQSIKFLSWCLILSFFLSGILAIICSRFWILPISIFAIYSRFCLFLTSVFCSKSDYFFRI